VLWLTLHAGSDRAHTTLAYLTGQPHHEPAGCDELRGWTLNGPSADRSFQIPAPWLLEVLLIVRGPLLRRPVGVEEAAGAAWRTLL
jgi:hypothetical protein